MSDTLQTYTDGLIRYRTVEDADKGTNPVFAYRRNGDRIEPNPEFDEANYEVVIFFGKDVPKLFIPKSRV